MIAFRNKNTKIITRLSVVLEIGAIFIQYWALTITGSAVRLKTFWAMSTPNTKWCKILCFLKTFRTFKKCIFKCKH